MSAPVLSCDETRELEKRAIEEMGMPSLLLMENAGRSIAEAAIQLGSRGPVLILCGKGNNGGDGLVVARHLDNQGIPIRVLLFGDPEGLSDDSSVNYRILTASGIEVELHDPEDLQEEPIREAIGEAKWIVDALFGSGLKGELRAPFDRIVQWVNESDATILAADIPSGLNGDTGEPMGVAIKADHTVTLIARKKGFEEKSSVEWTGLVHYEDCGIPRCLLPQG